MFYYVSGPVADIEPGLAVIDCGGVGYACATTNYTLSRLKKGTPAKLYTYLNVREDAMELFGFADQSELRSFKLLISVSGVGPRAALAILSAVTPQQLALAVVAGDEKALTAANGIGKKIAQRVILELKDKLSLEEAFEQKLANEQAQATTAAAGAGMTDARQEAVEALVALGYSSTDALRAVRKVTDVEPTDVEGILKAALKNF